MKRLWIVLIVLLMTSNGYCASQWAKLEPTGSRAGADLDAYQVVNNAALDRLAYNYRRGMTVVASSSSQVSVLAGEIAMPNSAGSVVRWRRPTSTTTVTFSDIDTGSEAVSTQYYVYAEGDTDETGCGFTISTSSTAPSGYTYYRKIGYFYNNSDGDIVNVGNIKNSDAPNIMSVTGTTDITTTSTSYEDMTDMEIRFVSNGRPVKMSFSASVTSTEGSGYSYAVIDIDGTDYAPTRKSPNTSSGTQEASFVTTTLQTLTAGTHTIKVQWKTTSGTAYQYGTLAERILTVEEA